MSLYTDALNFANTAQQKYNQAVSASQTGLSVLEDADPSASTAKIRSYGNEVAGVAGQLPGYATQISDLSKDLSASGQQLTDSGNSMMNVGNDLIGMNRNSNVAAVREALSIYDKYNPEDLVSFAAQDAYNSFNTGKESLNRDLTRSGINVGSGRYAALKQQYDIALNTAVAAAKTRARMSGLDAQTSAYQNLIANNALSFTNQAKDLLLAGSNVASNAIGGYAQAASIMKDSASLFGSAASLEETATNIDLGYAGKEVAQYNAIAAAMQAAGQNDRTTSQSYLDFIAAEDAIAARKAAIPTTTSYTDVSGNKILWNGSGWQSFNKTDSGWSSGTSSSSSSSSSKSSSYSPQYSNTNAKYYN